MMDFTLSLAHFCEVHGPSSILCTQLQPISCFSCTPRSIDSSFGDLDHGRTAHGHATQLEQPLSSKNSSFDFADAHDSAANDENGFGNGLASAILSTPTSPNTVKAFAERRNPFAAAGEDKGCISCSINIPQTLSGRLPAGAPGTPRANGAGRNGSPVLRSRIPQRVYDSRQYDSDTSDDEHHTHHPSPESYSSNTSSSSFHEHTLQYITTHNPVDPSQYRVLRNAVVRALTNEQLPRGQTSGKILFGDPVHGYTIAYKFRLPDPYARGGHRQYSLLALAGHEADIAFRTGSTIWQAFDDIAAWILAKTESTIQGNRQAEEEAAEKLSYVPVSSFLTGRTMDPDGYRRRNGGLGTRARGLTEMVGDASFFAKLHVKFVELLQALR